MCDDNHHCQYCSHSDDMHDEDGFCYKCGNCKAG